VLLLGDSMAMQLADGLAVSGEQGFVQATKTVCAPLLGISTYRSDSEYNMKWAEGCLSFQESLLEWLQAQPQIEVVVLAGWFGQFIDFPVLDGGRADMPPAGTPERVSVAAERLSAMAMRIHAMGKRVVIVEGIPGLPGFDVGRCLAMRHQGLRMLGSPASDCSIDRSDYERSAAQVHSLVAQAARNANVPVLRPAEVMCDTSRCMTEVDGVTLYRDAGHLSREGSRWLGRKMQLLNTVWNTAR
jgi:hypothetical protein